MASSLPRHGLHALPGTFIPDAAHGSGCTRCSGPSLHVVTDDKDAGTRLAYAIREAMRAADLTPPKLAAKLTVDPKTVNRWINGETVPNALTIRPLADALGVSPMLFVDPPPVPEYPLAEYLVRQATQDGLEEGLRRARPSPPQRRVS